MKQTFNAWSDFDKRTVISNDYDLAFDATTFNEILCHGIPWMRSELLHAQCNPLFVVIKVENNHVELLIQFNEFFRMVDPAPRHVCNVDQSIDAAEVDEHTV